jgi:hypothetical protein
MSSGSLIDIVMSTGSLIDLLEVLLVKQMGRLVFCSPLSSFFLLFAINSFICVIQIFL